MTGRRSPIAVDHPPPRAAIAQFSHNSTCLPGADPDERGDFSIRNHLTRWDCLDDSSNIVQGTHIVASSGGFMMRASLTLANTERSKPRAVVELEGVGSLIKNRVVL